MSINLDDEALRELIAEKVADSFCTDEDIVQRVNRVIEARIDKVFAERAAEAVEQAATRAVTEGLDRVFQKVNRFGQPEGDPTTIRKEMERLVDGYWSQRVDRNGKSTDSTYSTLTRAEYLMAQVCAEDFSAQMRQAAISVTAALKDGFRAQLAKHVDGLLDELFRVKSIQDQGKAEKPW